MPAVLYEKKGHIAYITLNRPEVLNAINSESLSISEDSKEGAIAFAQKRKPEYKGR